MRWNEYLSEMTGSIVEVTTRKLHEYGTLLIINRHHIRYLKSEEMSGQVRNENVNMELSRY